MQPVSAIALSLVFCSALVSYGLAYPAGSPISKRFGAPTPRDPTALIRREPQHQIDWEKIDYSKIDWNTVDWKNYDWGQGGGGGNGDAPVHDSPKDAASHPPKDEPSYPDYIPGKNNPDSSKSSPHGKEHPVYPNGKNSHSKVDLDDYEESGNDGGDDEGSEWQQPAGEGNDDDEGSGWEWQPTPSKGSDDDGSVEGQQPSNGGSNPDEWQESQPGEGEEDDWEHQSLGDEEEWQGSGKQLGTYAENAALDEDAHVTMAVSTDGSTLKSYAMAAIALLSLNAVLATAALILGLVIYQRRNRGRTGSGRVPVYIPASVKEESEQY